MQSGRMKRTELITLGLLASVATAPDALAQTLGWREVQFLTSGRDNHPLTASDGRVSFLGHFDPLSTNVPQDAVELTDGLLGLRIRPSELGLWATRHPDITLSHSAPLHPLLDLATVRSNMVAYRTSTGVGGKGVVVGVVDTGVDVMHPDLRDSTGHSRIAWLLDLSLPPMGLHADLETKYGCVSGSSGCAVLNSDDIDKLIADNNTDLLPTDTIGHGTHVASIAAGNGLGSTPPIYAGAAPDASLIVVRATRDNADDIAEADMLLGVRFVFEQAQALVPPLPAVVNLSLGTDFGPHDGTHELEQGLVSLVGSSFRGAQLSWRLATARRYIQLTGNCAEFTQKPGL
jgi:subtilisin family serine protease